MYCMCGICAFKGTHSFVSGCACLGIIPRQAHPDTKNYTYSVRIHIIIYTRICTLLLVYSYNKKT